MSHLPLDARAILHYLNELGYRNISSTQLKEFLKDLRKLIKYEERMGVNTQQNDYYEGLFRRTTASFRAKLGKENVGKLQTEKKISNLEQPTTSKQAYKNRQTYKRNHYATSSSSCENLDNDNPEKGKPDINISIVKALIEEKLTQVLHEKYSPKGSGNSSSKEEKTVRMIVEDVLKEKLAKLRNPEKEEMSTTEPGSLRSIIEDIVEQVLKYKLSNIVKTNYSDSIRNMEKDFQQKLNLSKEKAKTPPRESLAPYNSNRSLDYQALVNNLLDFGDGKKNANKENHIQPTCGIRRLQRSPRKKPEWQDPSQHDKILDKPERPLRTRSPAPSSSARSRRSKYSSSVMIRRLGPHKKPTSDPVALYQYYKSEWEHFRNQIPGEASHNRLRWHVRQCLLDPE